MNGPEIWISLPKMEIKMTKSHNLQVSHSLLIEETQLCNQIKIGDVLKIEFSKKVNFFYLKNNLNEFFQ